MTGTAVRPTLREQTRAAIRAQIADVALDLFAARGFAGVTVDEIAEEAGISTRSFNRYFPSKEDAVLGDSVAWGEAVRSAFEERPANEDPWMSLQHALTSLLSTWDLSDKRSKRGLRVIHETASLRARNLEKHLEWARLLEPFVAARIEAERPVVAAALTHSAMACFDAALSAWVRPGEDRSAAELLADAFGALNTRLQS